MSIRCKISSLTKQWRALDKQICALDEKARKFSAYLGAADNGEYSPFPVENYQRADGELDDILFQIDTLTSERSKVADELYVLRELLEYEEIARDARDLLATQECARI